MLVLRRAGLGALIAYRVCSELQAGEVVEQDRHRAEAEARLAAMRR